MASATSCFLITVLKSGMIINRKLRTEIPILSSKFKFEDNSSEIYKRNIALKEKQTKDYNKRHKTRDLPEA